MSNKYHLYQHTERLLSSVNQLDLPQLRQMVDDDFGIVDVDPEGNAVVINNMEEWEAYMEKNMIAMREMKAKLAYEIDTYNEKMSDKMAFVVVKFRQQVHLPEQPVVNHDCMATIVWKKTDDGWKEARWHCSRLTS